ncbi:MAG: exonuclease SbcCD subunit D C-terminal domain-containing protein [Solirubrobacterales bacterium]
MTTPAPKPGKDSIRILHTADWHLGREFHGRDLSSLHQAFFDWLANEIEVLQVDLLIMAGDIFDRALPPLAAIELLNRELARMADLCEVVLVTGNHDSTIRMSHGPLMRSGIHLRSGTTGLGIPIIPAAAGFPLAIYPIPYLDPGSAAEALGVDEARQEPVIRAAIDRSLNDLSDRPGSRSVAIGHAFILGGEESDSERPISMGGSDRVPAAAFEGFDYTALGHLHRAQESGKAIRYSGSPIPLSFSEVGAGLGKSVNVVDLPAEGPIEVEVVPVPQLVEMARISGTLDELLSSDDFSSLTDAWLEITLTDERRPDQPMERLRSRFENVISLRFESQISDGTDDDPRHLTEIARVDPIKLIESFIEHVRGAGPDPEEEKVLKQALASRAAEESR